MARGYAEMQRLALDLGAEGETLAGLSGFGDLVLTCGSEKSRNFRYGVALGAETEFDASTTSKAPPPPAPWPAWQRNAVWICRSPAWSPPFWTAC